MTAVNIGERARIELRCCTPQRAEVAALAFAEDRYRVLNSVRLLTVPTESPGQLIERADSERWEIGEVVLRRSAPQLVLDVVVYDLDELPLVSPEGVSLGLSALMEQLCRRRVTALAIEGRPGWPERMRGLTLATSLDGEEWKLVWAASEPLERYEIPLLHDGDRGPEEGERARYLRIASHPAEPDHLHLRAARIWGRRP